MHHLVTDCELHGFASLNHSSADQNNSGPRCG